MFQPNSQVSDVEQRPKPSASDGVADQQPERRRKHQQQHDVQRQHVHVDRLELEQQRLHDRDVRLLEEVQRVHFLGVERILEARRDIGDLGDVDREQEDVGDVDLPGPLQDARACDDKAALAPWRGRRRRRPYSRK